MSGLLASAKPYRIKAAHRRRRKVASGPIVQRYYDPALGRFLSVDPVTADGNTGGNFNRYWYANNNPYRFTDPDGQRDRDSLSAHFGNFTSAGSGFSAGPPSVRAGDNAPRSGNGGGRAGGGQNTGAVKAQSSGHHVYAVEPGKVRTIGWQKPGDHKAGAGYRVQIQETKDKVRIYGHMDPKSIGVNVNDAVADRQYIGNYADPTNGHSNGPHVHDQLMDFSGGIRRDIDPGRESPLGGGGGRVTTPFGVRDSMHPNAHQGTDWAD